MNKVRKQKNEECIVELEDVRNEGFKERNYYRNFLQKKFLKLIQTGNRFVRVDEIEKEERPYEENEKRFHVRY